MKRSFESVFRKAQDAGRARLHQYAADGQLAGFVMPYLGNQDRVKSDFSSDVPLPKSAFAVSLEVGAETQIQVSRFR